MPNNKKSSYTIIDNNNTLSSPQSFIGRRYSSIPSSSYLTVSSSYFTDSPNSKNPYKNNSIDTNSSSDSSNNNGHYFSFNEPSSFKLRRGSCILQAETLKNSFNELDNHNHHRNDQSSLASSSPPKTSPQLSPSKNPFLTDIEMGVHPLASSDIKDNNYLSPPPVNDIQRNSNKQPFYFRRPSIYEKNDNKKDDEQQQQQQQQQKEEEDKDKVDDGVNNTIYSTTPFIERPIITKDLHITLPDVKRNYFDISITEEEEKLRLPYPLRKKEPITKRLGKTNQSNDNSKQQQQNQKQKQPFLRHSVDNSEIDRLSYIDINTTDQDKNDKMIDPNSLVTSWLDTSVNI